MADFFDFTSRRFKSLPLKTQHVKCIDCLKAIYHQMIAELEWQPNWNDYLTLLKWMNDEWPNDHAQLKITHKIVANRLHWHQLKSGISTKEHRLLPQIRKGDKETAEDSWPITVYLDNIRSAHNVGSIIRTVESFSLGQIAFSPDTPFTTHKQVQNTSMETFQWVNCFKCSSIQHLPRPIIALETSHDAVSIFNFAFPDSFTLVLGNEEFGCSDDILTLSDHIIEIPLRGKKNSLNVANAFAIVAAEIYRQRLITHNGCL